MTHEDPARGYRRLLVYGDDVGVPGPGGAYLAFGSLWLPWERRGDLLRLLAETQAREGWERSIEAAGQKLDAEPFVKALLDEVFRRRWIAFRCLLTRPDGRPALADSAFTALLALRLRAFPGGLTGRELRIRTTRRADLAPRAAKAHLADLDQRLVRSLGVPAELQRSLRPARSPEPLEVVRLLSSLIVEDWEKKPTTAHRRRLSLHAAENLGWSDLAADTDPAEWKMNIAFVEDPESAAQPPRPTRTVQLRLPLVD